MMAPHRLARHSYRTTTPRFARRRYAWWANNPGPVSPMRQRGPSITAQKFAHTSASRRRCRRTQLPDLRRPSQLPHYRLQSRRDNKAPQTQPMLATRVPHQSSRHGYRRRGILARKARGPLVEPDAQGAYRLGGAVRRLRIRAEIATALLSEWGMRGIPQRCAGRRIAPSPPAVEEEQ